MASVTGQQDSIVVEEGISYTLADTTRRTRLASHPEYLGIKSRGHTYTKSTTQQTQIPA